MSDHNELKELLISNEGRVLHMYLDTVGRVTVGVGHMIPSAQAAQTLDFVDRQSKQKATPQQIADEHNNISRQQQGMLASRYQQFAKLELTAAAIEDLLSTDIANMEAGVRSKFSLVRGICGSLIRPNGGRELSSRIRRTRWPE